MRAIKLLVPAVLAVCASGAAFGQATLKGIEGTVLVTKGDALVAAANGQQLALGTRIVTTAGARATISQRGCEIKLEGNQRFIVREAGNCAAMVASVERTAQPSLASARMNASDVGGIYYQALGDSAAGGAAGAGGVGTAGLIIGGVAGAAMLGYAINDADKSGN